jgi:methyl-accepting chemotaxis protein
MKKQKSMSSKLYMLAGVSVAGLLIFGAVAFTTMNSVKINGPNYLRVAQNKDLLGDMMTPPICIVEAYLVTERLENAQTPEELNELVGRYEQLKKDYFTRQEFWSQRLPEGAQKQAITKDSRVPVEQFFEVVERDLIPAVKAEDSEAAHKILSTKLPPLYAKHKTIADKVVEDAVQIAAHGEADVAKTVTRTTWILALIGFASIVTVGGITFMLRRSVVEQEKKDLDNNAQIAAIGKSQAVIDFNMDGTIRSANDNFLRALGYSLDEIKGRHHGMFVEESYRHSPEYKEFWAKLGRGEYAAGEFCRYAKGGKEIWIQASYNPILDASGKPFKVVKYASDITEQVKARREMARILDMVNANATTLGSSAEELTAVSTQMASNASETSAQANIVSAASEQVSKNVQTVATGVDEMNAAIRDIAKNAMESARVAQQAVAAAEVANTTIGKLGESSTEIGNVIKVITSIAEQTNLLALNATIEAARAGEAGKGFAVVANEVKELAKETARATEDISRRIEAIQTDTRGAVDSIQQIGSVIGQINDISNTIASAVEEQTATATEMSRNVGEAAKGTAEIAQNITAVAQAAQDTTQGANNSQQAAAELSRMANELQHLGAGRATTHALAV